MRGLIPALGLLLWSGAALADPLEDLRGFYRTVGALTADFEQRLIDEDGETLERYAGRLWLQRPGRFLWLYDAPYDLRLGSDGRQLWHYDVDLRQVTLRDAKQSLSGTPAELLGGDLAMLDNYRFERLPDADGLAWLRLIPRDTESDFSQIRIGLLKGQPRRVHLEDRLGQLTQLRLIDLRPNVEIDPGRFLFKAPQGVTVVDERAAP